MRTPRHLKANPFFPTTRGNRVENDCNLFNGDIRRCFRTSARAHDISAFRLPPHFEFDFCYESTPPVIRIIAFLFFFIIVLFISGGKSFVILIGRWVVVKKKMYKNGRRTDRLECDQSKRKVRPGFEALKSQIKRSANMYVEAFAYLSPSWQWRKIRPENECTCGNV